MREYVNINPNLYEEAEALLDNSVGWNSKINSYVFKESSITEGILDAVFLLLHSKGCVLLRRKGNYLLLKLSDKLVNVAHNPDRCKSLINRTFEEWGLKVFWTFRLNHYLQSAELQSCLDECLESSWLISNRVLCLDMLYQDNLSIHEIARLREV